MTAEFAPVQGAGAPLSMPISRSVSATAATACRISFDADRADAADPERLDLGQLAGIEDEAAPLGCLVEGLEIVAAVARRMERHDDRRLQLGLQERHEAERRHAVDQRLAVLGVARQPRRLAALLDELVDRRAERRDHMGRRREAPLAGPLHVDVLVVQVHRERLRLAGAAVEHGLADQHEAHARHAFEALAAGRDQRIEADLARIDLERAERAHRVDDQALVVARADMADLLQRIQHAGAGLAVDQADVGDALVGGEPRIELVGRDRLVLAPLHDRRAPAHQGREPAHPLAVGAVVEHQQVAGRRRHDRRDRGLDRERAAALQRHGDVRLFGLRDLQQLATDARGQRIEVGVPRTPVAQHRELGAQGRRQRSGCQQNGITVHAEVS